MKKHMWDNPDSLKRFLKLFFGLCIALFVIDFIHHRHGHVHWEEWPGFFDVFGFVACIVLVLVSKYLLRPLVERDETYYDS